MHARFTSRALAHALVATAVVLGGAAVPASAQASPAGKDRAGSSRSVAASPSGRYLVRYADHVDIRSEARSLRSRGVAVPRAFGRAIKAAVVRTSRAEAVALARDPEVLAVEPDVRITTTGTQSNAPWGLDRIDQRSLPLSSTYSSSSNGSGVTVYVVDTGVNADHTEFGGRVAAGFTAIQDGNGTSDCNSHGTHVAGTVAGSKYGVAKGATIVPVRVLGCDGTGWGSDLLKGLDWVVSHHAAGKPAVLNMSLGGDTPSSTVDNAVENVMRDGITVTVAAGNEGSDACAGSPARVPGALTVAASDQNDQQPSFSNHGSCVDLFAPGKDIVAAGYGSSTQLLRMSGTSMATPHVAGAAALLLSQQPSLSPAQVAASINNNATTGAIGNETFGTPDRLLYVGASSSPSPSSPTSPSEPTSTSPEPDSSAGSEEPPVSQPVVTAPSKSSRPSAAARRRGAKVTWRQGSDGGSPLTAQVIRVYKGTKRVAAFKVPGHVTAVRVSGLRPGRYYKFTVIAKNAEGRSPESRRSNRIRAKR